MAYLKRSRRRKGSQVYESWAVVESVRTARGPRQRTIATIGKAPGLDAQDRVGWENIAEILSGRPGAKGSQTDLFQPPAPDPPDWACVDLGRVRVERLRRFGDVYLALALWKRLRLDEFFAGQIASGKEEVAWETLAALHAIARFCEPSSDLAIAESFFPKTALDDLLGLCPDKLYDNRLYRALDVMEPCREALFAHLRRVYGELFGAQFDVLLYDVTSTFFEGQAADNELAARGYSRDQRPDCAQVTIGLVVTPEQLPLAYEVFEGNRPDTATLEDVFNLMEKRYGKAQRTWVLDRGFVSEANLAALRRRGALYLVGAPRSALKKCEKQLLEGEWDRVAPQLEAKIVSLTPGQNEEGGPDPGARETYLLCRSTARIEKDKAIVEKAAARLEKALRTIEERILGGRLRDLAAAERQVGRTLQKYQRAARLFRVKIAVADEQPGAEQAAAAPTKGSRSSKSKTKEAARKPLLTMELTRDDAASDWAALQNGCYLLRTNIVGKSAEELWRTYIGLTEAEAAFRALKSPLGMRPVFHRKTGRVQAHVLTCFVALAMRRALSIWMRDAGLGTAPDKLLAEMATIHSLDVVLTGPEEREIRLRVVGTPEDRVRELLHALRLKIPNRPKRIQHVVATSGPQQTYVQQNQPFLG